MTLNDLHARIGNYFAAEGIGTPPPPIDVVETIKEDALGELAEQTATGDKPELLQRDVTLTLAAGVADLSAHTDILINHILRVEHENAEIGELSNARSWAYLRAPKSEIFNWYLKEKNRLYCRKGNGKENTDDGQITVLAQFTPTLATVPVDLEPDLIALTAKAYLMLLNQ